MTVTVKCDGMECEVVEGERVSFRRTLAGGTVLEGCIMWDDLPAHALKKVEPLTRRANNNAFELVRTLLMSHDMDFNHPLSVLEVVPVSPMEATTLELEDAA